MVKAEPAWSHQFCASAAPLRENLSKCPPARLETRWKTLSGSLKDDDDDDGTDSLKDDEDDGTVYSSVETRGSSRARSGAAEGEIPDLLLYLWLCAPCLHHIYIQGFMGNLGGNVGCSKPE